jgi:hypothetical protein
MSAAGVPSRPMPGHGAVFGGMSSGSQLAIVGKTG